MIKKGFVCKDIILSNISTIEELKAAFFESCKKLYHIELGLRDWEERAEKRWKMIEAKSLVKKYFLGNHYKKNNRILDVGSGWGGLVYQGLKEGFNIYGVELSSELSLLSCKHLILNDMENRILRGNGEKLCFKDNVFDYVYSFSVLEHVSDPKTVLQEMVRVLKPGGILIISIANYLSFSERHYKCFWFPLLPKKLGALYLKLRKRNTGFLWDHITYTNYLLTRKWIRKLPVKNITDSSFKKVPTFYKKFKNGQKIFEFFFHSIFGRYLLYFYRFLRECFKTSNHWELIKRA